MPRTLSVLTTAGLLAAGLATAGAAPAAANPDVEDTGLTTAVAPALDTAASGTAAANDYLVGASNPAPVLGDLPVERVFRDRIGSAPSSRVVVSFRDWDEDAVHTFVRQAVDGTAVAFTHEPEQEINSRKMSAGSWADRTVDIANIIQQEGRVGEVKPITILMAWTLDDHSHRQQMLSDMLSPRVLDALRSADGVLGWDSYAGPRSGRTPQEMYGPGAAFAARQGLDWAITETGAKVADPARWVQTFNYLDSLPVKPRYFLSWNPGDKNGGVFAIQNQPAVAAVWRDAIRTHSG